MSDREKLIKLLCEANSKSVDAELFEDSSYAQQLEMEADFLIANGVTIQRWIPVTERFPDDNVQVLACTRKGKPFPAHCEGGKWRVSHSVTITHWMALPEPPKEEL